MPRPQGVNVVAVPFEVVGQQEQKKRIFLENKVI